MACICSVIGISIPRHGQPPAAVVVKISFRHHSMSRQESPATCVRDCRPAQFGHLRCDAGEPAGASEHQVAQGLRVPPGFRLAATRPRQPRHLRQPPRESVPRWNCVPAKARADPTAIAIVFFQRATEFHPDRSLHSCKTRKTGIAEFCCTSTPRVRYSCDAMVDLPWVSRALLSRANDGGPLSAPMRGGCITVAHDHLCDAPVGHAAENSLPGPLVALTIIGFRPQKRSHPQTEDGNVEKAMTLTTMAALVGALARRRYRQSPVGIC